MTSADAAFMEFAKKWNEEHPIDDGLAGWVAMRALWLAVIDNRMKHVTVMLKEDKLRRIRDGHLKNNYQRRAKR